MSAYIWNGNKVKNLIRLHPSLLRERTPPTSTGSVVSQCTKEAGALCCIPANGQCKLKYNLLGLEKLEILRCTVCCVSFLVQYFLKPCAAA